MLNRKKESPENGNQQLFRTYAEGQKGILEELMSGYSKLTVDDPMMPFKEKNLQEVENNLDYGNFKGLDGTWVSYNANYNRKLRMRQCR